MPVATILDPEDDDISRLVEDNWPDINHAATSWPASLTPLVGRQRQVNELLDLFRADETRLITLTGPGGVGKTRLALHAGALLREAFPSGVAFVALASVGDPSLVPAAIARAFAIRETSERPITEQLRRAFRNWSGLLILDNFEQVAEGAPVIADLLTGCPRLKVLVTSRTVLRLSGEREMDVPPLTVPLGSDAIEDAAQSDSISLFVQRAQAVRPEFALTNENVAAVVEICRRLDGLPLAIELAAARSKVLSPPALLARLSRRLQILTSGPHDQPARLQTMRSAIAWSFDLLTSEEQLVFRRLSLFVGGFSLEAAEHVVGETEAHPLGNASLSVFDGVSSLLDKSLVRRIDGPGDADRFFMLETIREFGLEELHSSGEELEIRRRHADWYVSIGEEAWKATIERVNIVPMLDRLEIEFDDVRATLSWLEASGDDNFLRLASSMTWFCFARGHLREGIAWLERALSQSDGESTAIRARALLSAGMLTHYFGDDAKAIPFLERSLKLYRELNDSWGASSSLTMLGIVAEDTGNYDRAIEHLSESLAFSRAAHEPLVVALSLYHLGVATWGQGNGERAKALLVEAMAAQKDLGDTSGYGDSIGYLGLIASEQGDWEQSGALIREGLALHLELRSQEDIATSLANMAVVAATSAQPTVAARLLSKASAMRGELGNPFKLPERDVYDRTTASVRATLGPSAFEEARTKGASLPLAEAIVQALAVNSTAGSGAESEQNARTSFGLTTRELEVLQLIATGLTDRAIGNALYISARTAQKHVATILAKLGVNTRTAATTTALRSGIVKIDGESPAPANSLI